MLLQVSGIGKKPGGKWVLKDTGFTQERFQKIAVAGETGAGKSTLLKIIAGLEHPDAGTVFFEGKKITSPRDTLIPGHPGIAYLSQHFELRNNYRVEELPEYASLLNDADAQKLFEVCRIGHLLKRRTDQLSGGERQRIALAGLLAGSPRLLLLDEPFSNLDPIHKNLLRSVLHDIGEKLQITCILTSHDPLDTLSWADEIIVLRDGKTVQQDKPPVLYYHPANEYVAGLLGSYNLLDASEARLFFGANGWNDNSKKLFVRPEKISIIHAHSINNQSIIEKEKFSGMFTELTILNRGKSVRVKTTNTIFHEGDTVQLGLAPGYEPHFLSQELPC